MSVWKSACYKDDAFHAVTQWFPKDSLDCTFVRSLCNFSIGDPGSFSLPEGVVAGNLRNQVDANPQILCALHDPVQRPDPDAEAFVRFCKTLGEAKFGLCGIYHFIADHWNEFFKPGQIDKAKKSYYGYAYVFGAAASYRTPREAADKAKSSIASIEKYLAGPVEAIRTLIRAGTLSAGPKYRADIRYARSTETEFPTVQPKDPGFLAKYDIYWWKGTLFLVEPYFRDTYVFTREDINRIERVVLGLAWCKLYFAEYTDITPGLNDRLIAAFTEVTDCIKETFKHVNQENANSACRAYDVLVWRYFAELATDVDSRALHQQEEKIRREKLGELVNVEKMLRVARGFKEKEALELLQVYKCFPQPDFDYFGAAKRQQDLYSNNRPSWDEVADNETGTPDDFWRYFKYTLIRAYHQKHGVCPGAIADGAGNHGWRAAYPHISPDKINPAQVDDINIHGSFKYIPHGYDILDLVKDKAICPGEIDNVKTNRDLQALPIESRNQLMDVLGRKEPINLAEMISSHDKMFNDVKADDKPEAKKPNGRWFFEAGTDRRLVQSEYEASVAEYAKSTVGCMAGKGVREKVATMNYITELPHIGTEEFTRPFFISFDLDKFSPSLSTYTHQRGDAILADAFGVPSLAEASDVYSQGHIHYVKHRVHHKFEKMGRDFEGFSGRKNTIYHCAAMGYCVRRLREMGVVSRGGRFASLIDDGVLRLEIPTDGYLETVKKVLSVIEKVYNMCNMYISWDKTFVSSTHVVFLNEFYIRGTPVTPGIRTFLKITNRSDVLCPSILDDLGMLESTTRGAISAGTSPSLAYMAYAYLLMDTMAKWGKGRAVFGTKLALASFSPVAFGGFGCVGMAALSGSVTSNPIIEGIGNLRAIAVRYKMLAPNINAIINQPMRTVTPVERLRSPLAVRREGRTLKATRGRNVLERKLVNMIDTPVIRSLVGNVGERSVDSIVDAIPSFGATSVEFLDSVWRSSLEACLSNIAAKFLRARTATKLVRRTAFHRAFLANCTEAAILIGEWK